MNREENLKQEYTLINNYDQNMRKNHATSFIAMTYITKIRNAIVRMQMDIATKSSDTQDESKIMDACNALTSNHLSNKNIDQINHLNGELQFKEIKTSYTSQTVHASSASSEKESASKATNK